MDDNIPLRKFDLTKSSPESEKKIELNIPLLIVRIIIVLMAISIFIIGTKILYDSVMDDDYKASKIWVGGIIMLAGFSYTSYNLVKLANQEPYQGSSYALF